MEGKQRGQQEVGQHSQHDVAPYSGAVDGVHPAGQGSRRAHLFDSGCQGRLPVKPLGFQFGSLVFDVGLQLLQYLPLVLRVEVEASGQRIEVIVDCARHLSNALTVGYWVPASIMESIARLKRCHSRRRSSNACRPLAVIR